MLRSFPEKRWPLLSYVPLRLTKYKLVIGLFFALAVLVSPLLQRQFPGLYHIRLAFFFIFFGFFRIDLSKYSNWKYRDLFISLLRLTASLAALFFLARLSLSMLIDAELTLSPRGFFHNLLCAFVLYAIIQCICNNAVLSSCLSLLILLLLSSANTQMFLYRGKELLFSDFYAVGTAIGVLKNYRLLFPVNAVICWQYYALILFAFFSLPVHAKRERERRALRRLLWLIIALASYGIMSVSLQSHETMFWSTFGSEYNGFYVNYYTSIRDSVVRAPDGYSSKTVDALASEYEASATTQVPSRLPNIVVIMNESFSDLSSFDNGPVFSQPLTPFLSSLHENTVKGEALVSVFAGNTANSEMEFLTSHSLAFFPSATSSNPYQQYLFGDTVALPMVLRSMGYSTFATHPYIAQSYSREKVYPWLGFERTRFINDYPGTDLVRSFISDREMYQIILDELHDSDSDSPSFIFGITMQNHGDYTYWNENERTIKLEWPEKEYPLAEEWLSLIHESDKAFSMLVDALTAFPEPTVVLLFGDHLPGIEADLYNTLSSGEQTLDEQMKKYVVPFYIWANYDIEEVTLPRTSLNYLAGHLLDAAGIPLPPYHQFLRDMEERIPQINAYGYYSVAQQKMLFINDADGDEGEALKLLHHVQYNNLFDQKNRNWLFFSQYLPS